MQANELRDMTLDELDDQRLKLKQELFNIRFQLVSGEFTNTARIRDVRRDVARVETVLRARRANGESGHNGESG